MSSDKLQRVHDLLQRHIDSGSIPGAVSLIFRRGKIVYFESQGYMDLESKTPMRKDAIFQLASMTKPMTALAAMILLEEGRILLNDPVSKYLPEFSDLKVAVANLPNQRTPGGYHLVAVDRPVTLHDLLAHTSGFASGTSGPIALYQKIAESAKAEPTLAGKVKLYASLPLNFQPGSAWEYSGIINFDTMSRVIEVVSGQRLDQFFQERIFSPLGMSSTYFYLPERLLPRLASSYVSGPDGDLKKIPGSRSSPRDRGAKFFSGAGNLSASPEDYLRFALLLLNKGHVPGSMIVGPKSVELMTSNAIGSIPLWNRETGFQDMSGYRWGLGLQVRSDSGAAGWLGSVGSFGWTGALGTLFWVDPKEELIGILMTSRSVVDLWFEFPNVVYGSISSAGP